VIELGADFDPATGAGAGLRTLYGSLGRGGFEGIHPDDQGNILIIEDVVLPYNSAETRIRLFIVSCLTIQPT
jgi:hypothetical protein